MIKKKRNNFDSAFYPESVAVIGASREETKFGNFFFERLISSDFEGDVYPINPKADGVLGVESYPDLKSVPDSIDYAIVSVPSGAILDVLVECGEKGVKIVHIFTAGFSETGETENVDLEKKIVKKANKYGFRVIGPNCIGTFCTRTKLPSTFERLGEPGSVSFVSQSGGHLEKLVREGIDRGIKFSKGVSVGNACDLETADFLKYFSNDPETEIVGVYLEGVENGQRLLKVLREMEKPVVVWKAGRTTAGGKAASSHTASVAGSVKIWNGILSQTCSVKVDNLQEWKDTILAFQDIPNINDRNIGLIGGLIDGAGGRSVAGSDTCAEEGLNLPSFSRKVKKELEKLIPQAGSITRNPLDLSQIAGNLKTISRILNLLEEDPNISSALINLDLPTLSKYRKFLEPTLDKIVQLLTNFEKKSQLPLIVVTPTTNEKELEKHEKKLTDAQIPTFPTMTRAAKAIRNIVQYFEGESKYP